MPNKIQNQHDLPKPVIEYPTFEVVTPQTNRSILVQSMTVREEKILKGSRDASPYSIPDRINRFVFSLIVNKKKPYDTFEGFLKNFTPNDRAALLYGIYKASYEDIEDFTIACSNPTCSKPNYTVKVPIEKITTIDFYTEKESILKKKATITLPISKTVVTLRQYTLYEEAMFFDTLKKARMADPGNMERYLFIEKIELPTTQGVLTYENLMDIDYAMEKLPSKDAKLLFKTIYDEFSKYGISMVMNTTCPTCGTENETYLDIVGELFRVIF